MEYDPRTEARAAMVKLLDRLAILVLTLGVATTVIGLVRITSRGWQPNVITDLVFFVPIVVVVLLRRWLSVDVVVWLIVGLTAASAVASFITLGLGTVSFVTLSVCCTFVGVVFGMRAGFVFLGGSILVVGAIGAAICSGRLGGLQVTDPYLFEPQTWITQIAGFAGYTAAILVVGGVIEGRVTSMLRELSLRAEELRESERNYRLLADHMKDVLFFQDLNLDVKFVSPSAEKLFGYSMDEMHRMKMGDFLTPESLERAIGSFRHFVALAEAGDVEVPPMEFEYLRKDGSSFWGELTPSFVRDAHGDLIGSQGLLRDITQRKVVEHERAELERELRQAEKLKAIGQLAGGIAHDFNNQLAPIMAHADMIARGLVAGDEVTEHARKILAPARNAADLTSKLLAFARKGSYEKRSFDMHEVINEVVEILVHGIDRRIQLSRFFEAESAVVEGDRTQLQNVLLNLALNARDAMPEGGRIVFATRTTVICDEGGSIRDRWLEISVVDDGLGMDESVRERAFEPFFTTKPPGKGTGMGLAAAYGTIASHGGRIDISSGPGEGSEVLIRLPLSARQADAKTDTLADILAPGSGRAMVVDDEESVRSALCELLENLGFSVEAFDRAVQATAYYADHWRDIDVVVLDLVLPDMSGQATLRRIRELNREARVLLVSGYTADDGIRQLLESGTVEFLEKPFLLADLAERLARIMGRR